MDHRYGRHGSRAWLRWRQRHYVQPPTSLVPVVRSTFVIQMHIPPNTERIIIIVQQPEGFEESVDRRMVPSDSMTIQYLPGRDTGEMQKIASPKLISSLQRRAERRAIDDIEDLESLAQRGKYILIHRERIQRKGRKHAKQDISNDELNENVSYEDLLRTYQRAYQQTIDDGLSQLGGQVTEITDEREKQLRETLNKDRTLVQDNAPDDWHVRDLVLVRVLQIYYGNSLEEVGIDVLQERNALIGRYERYIRDFQSRNEVIWPDQESF
jgi:hypothetical protein